MKKELRKTQVYNTIEEITRTMTKKEFYDFIIRFGKIQIARRRFMNDEEFKEWLILGKTATIKYQTEKTITLEEFKKIISDYLDKNINSRFLPWAIEIARELL